VGQLPARIAKQKTKNYWYQVGNIRDYFSPLFHTKNSLNFSVKGVGNRKYCAGFSIKISRKPAQNRDGPANSRLTKNTPGQLKHNINNGSSEAVPIVPTVPLFFEGVGNKSAKYVFL